MKTPIKEIILIINLCLKALDKAVAEERARFAEEFAKLEHQLNDVRREHTKAVVSLRQVERQVAREQEKAEGQLAQERREYEASLEKNKVQLMSLEKERNMLMATVRQEGLRVPRPKAKDYESSSGTVLQRLSCCRMFYIERQVYFLK